MKIIDMPKLESPFVREIIDGNYIVTPKITEGYEWVFEDEEVMAIEKLHGTNVSIIIECGMITAIFNRTARIPFFNKGKKFIFITAVPGHKKFDRIGIRNHHTGCQHDFCHFIEMIFSNNMIGGIKNVLSRSIILF